MEKKKSNVVIRAVCLILAAILIVVGIVVGAKYIKINNENSEPELITVTTVETDKLSGAETTTTIAATDETAVTNETTETSETGVETTVETTSEATTDISETIETSDATTIEIETISEASTTESTVVEVPFFSAAAPIAELIEVPHKSIEEIAAEVWLGLWGVGEERKRLLTEAGYDYAEVQKKVDEMNPNKGTTPNNPVAAPDNSGKTFVKTFSRGTYYAYGCAKKGGSGRQLINCATGGQGVKGSIASWYLYKNYGYNYKGKRTKVYLEISGYSSMNGWYYLDDSCAPGYNNVIDFFYINGKSCPFSKQGVVTVKCYI